MKNNTIKYVFSAGFLLFLVACSTKNNTFLSRNSHALSTEYNILYNGQIGLNKGLEGIKSNSKDNYWSRLPIEKMMFDGDKLDTTKNADFELAETKATKAIQKHSMNIGGRENNSQIDEAYLLLGKARYYDQRFIPALDAFNYILYKYPDSDKISQAKIWREKTNMRLGNDALVVKNISKLLENNNLKKPVLADANALLAEAFLNLEEKDSAVAKLKLAVKFTKRNSEKARYRFVLGQLYQELGKKDSALYCYESVIAMNRKAAREYVIHSHAKKAELFDYKNGDTTAFLKTYRKLIADRENRPFLDVIFHQMAVFYDKNNNQKLATHFYNASLKKTGSDQYLTASNYRNLGNMHFKNADYPMAAKYYDSTLVKLDAKTREYLHIEKTRKNLDEAIEYDAVAKRNDSIINVVSLSESDRILYFETYIDKLKKADEAKRIFEEKQQAKLDNIKRNSGATAAEPAVAAQESGRPIKKSLVAPPSIADASVKEAASTFYFYNPTLVAFGKLEFKKTWGDRSLGGNWRLSNSKDNITSNDSINDDATSPEKKLATEKTVEKYTTDYYVKQLPTTQTAIDSIIKERNFAYYQLGVVYKEKFKEYELASTKLEQLLTFNPEEKLILPAMYNLYKIYQITNGTKAEEMKNKISAQYPDSRYAQIINNANPNEASANETPEDVYNKWYKLYLDQEFIKVLENSDALISQFSGDPIVSKLELLRANTIGKLSGLLAYKKALQELADNYPNSEEGKNAQEILANQIPFLEKMEFNDRDTKNWKILYKVTTREDKDTKAVEEKIKKFIASESLQKLSYSFDNYNGKENFITIHGLKAEIFAKDIVALLKEKKEYKMETAAIVITNENYKVIQIKKNLDTYLALKKQ